MKKLISLLFLFFSFIHTTGEKVPFSLLKRLLPSNPVILEAGAQYGEDTKWMSELWPQGTIHSFEPLPEAFACLQQVAAIYPNVHCYQLALSEKQGVFNFYVSGGASSLLKPTEQFNNDYFHSDLEHPISVQCLSLDEWVSQMNIDHIDFLWLDMEGNELHALKSGIKILETVTVIYTEVNLQKFWEGCVLYQELKQWLEDQGFEELWSDIVPHWHGNALFVRT
jgi:FkbM family methyltransferase